MQVVVPTKKRILVLEWKVIQIDYLDLGAVASREKKAERLQVTFEASAILDLKFGANDRWRQGQTIKEWILEGPRNGPGRTHHANNLQRILPGKRLLV